jgi:hypothetical protein
MTEKLHTEWKRNFKLSFIPFAITFSAGFIEIAIRLLSKTSGSNGFDGDLLRDFLSTNTFGLCLSIMIEMHKRWTTETQMAHFAEHLPTSSSIYGNLMQVVERVDSTAKQIESTRSIVGVIGRNPLENRLQKLLKELSSELSALSEGRISTQHEENVLSVELSSKVAVIRAISIAETDLDFWKSPPGVKYFETQRRIVNLSPGLSTNIDSPFDMGVYRIFSLESHTNDEVKSEIVKHVNAGVKVAVYLSRDFSSAPPDELGIFGSVAVRRTRFTGSRSTNLQNEYLFSTNDIEAAIEQFEVWWNKSIQIVAPDHENFTLSDLSRLLE